MDSNQFDRIARIVGSGSSRRAVLKSLAGGVKVRIMRAGSGP